MRPLPISTTYQKTAFYVNWFKIQMQNRTKYTHILVVAENIMSQITMSTIIIIKINYK